MVAFGDKTITSLSEDSKGQLTSPARPTLDEDLAPLNLLNEVNDSGVVGGLIRFGRVSICHSSGDPVYDRLGCESGESEEYVTVAGRNISSIDVLSNFNLTEVGNDAGNDTSFPTVLPINREFILNHNLN